MAYFSNGTQGMDYQDRYCANCANADEDGCCGIWDAHLLYSYGAEGDLEGVLDILIPSDAAGNPTKCSMHRPVQS